MSPPTNLTMKLESLTATGQIQKKVKLQFEDGTSLQVLPEVVADFGLHSGMELSEEEQTAIFAAQRRASAKARAVRIVSASNISKQELGRRLEQKGELAEDAAEAVAWLEELNILDDSRMAKLLVQKEAAKGHGLARMKQVLYQKGIPQQLWDEALAGRPEADEAIDRFLSSRLKGSKPDQQQSKKLIDALLRRGHSWSDIKKGLARYEADLADVWEEEL